MLRQRCAIAALVLAATDISIVHAQPNAGAGVPPSGAGQPAAEPAAPADTNPVRGALSDEGSPAADIFALRNDIADPRAPAWLITPSLGLRGIYTDNVRNSAVGKRSDFIGEVTFGLAASSDTPRLQSDFSYQGILRRYAKATEQNRLSHYGLASASLNVIEDALVLDLRGRADEVDRTGADTLNPSLRTRDDTTQTFGVMASPHMVVRVGGAATASLRYSINQNWYDRNTGAIATSDGDLAPLSDSTQQQADTSLDMPDMLAVGLTTRLNAAWSQSESARALGSFRRYNAGMTNEFMLSPSFTVIGVVGYEDLKSRFAGANGEGVTWSGGATWQPAPDSTLTVSYGRRDLYESFYGNANIALSELSYVTASYTDVVTRPQAGTGFGAGGIPITPGQPIPPNGAGGIGGIGQLQNDLNRQRSFVAGIASTFDTTQVGLDVRYLSRKSLTGLFAGTRNSTGFRVSVLRNITDYLSARGDVGLTFEDFNNAEIFNGAFSLNYDVTPTLGANLRYDYVSRESDVTTRSYDKNSVTLSLRQVF